MSVTRGTLDGEGILMAERPSVTPVEAQMARDLAMLRMRHARRTNAEIARFFKCTVRNVQMRVNALPEHARGRVSELLS